MNVIRCHSCNIKIHKTRKYRVQGQIQDFGLGTIGNTSFRGGIREKSIFYAYSFSQF